MGEGGKRDGVSPIVAVCCLAMLLSACIGGIIELAGGKGTRLWVIAGGPVLLSGAVVGIHMIVTKRAFYKSRDYVGRDAVVVGILFLLVFGSAFIFLVTGALWASPQQLSSEMKTMTVTQSDEQKICITLDGFYQFLCAEMTLFEFESWLREHRNVEEIIGRTAYNDLLSSDFYDDSVETSSRLRLRLVEIHRQCGPALLEKEMGRRLLCTFLSGRLDAITFLEEMNYLLQRGQDWIPVYIVGLLSELDNSRRLPTEPAKLRTMASELLSKYFPGQDCSSTTSPLPYFNFLHDQDRCACLRQKQRRTPPKGPQKPPRELPRQNPRVPFYDGYRRELENDPRVYGVEAEAVVVDCGSTREGLPKWEDSDITFHFWTYEYEYRDPGTGGVQKHQDTLVFTASIWGHWFRKYNVGFRFQVRYHKRVPSVHVLLHDFD